MHLFKVAFYITGITYSFVNPEAILIFLGIIAIGWLFGNFIPGAKSVANNRKVSFAAWSQPKEGNFYIHEEIRVDKVQQFLTKNYKKEQRPTLTHVVVRAIAQALKNLPELNGKIAFGQFVPFKTVDISVLVQIDNGNDLAMMLLSDCASKTFQDLRQIIAKRSARIKSSSQGDQQHKKRTGAAAFLPTFILAAVSKILRFVTCDLGLNLKALGMRKNGFGIAMVTAIGQLGFLDATAPFTSFSNNSLILAINKIHQKPVIQNDQIKIGKFVNINIVIDYRLFAQTNNKNFFPIFRSVFQNPQRYSRVQNL